MSELKAHKIGDLCFDFKMGKDVGIDFYLKSEADKVIANRDYEIEKLKKSIDRLLKAKTEQVIDEVMQNALIYGEGFVRVEDAMKLIVELNHNKYKRCLAMADKCSEAICYWDNVKYTFFKGEAYCFRKMNHYGKWGQIWLAIADKLERSKCGRREMKRKERMEWYIERICKMLRNLPATQANEIECRALWNNLQFSHEDIVTRYIDKEAK